MTLVVNLASEEFHEFLEKAARLGYERLRLALQSQMDSGKIKQNKATTWKHFFA